MSTSPSNKRFAITATDRYLTVLDAFVAQGWQAVKLFTTPVDGRLHQNKAVIQRAQQLGIDVQISRMSDANLAALKEADCDLLVVASYAWRIGNWRPYLNRAINFHPSPLPRYRGPMPQVWAILDDQRQWAVSCHKLEPDFDSGDVLVQQPIELSDRECADSLDLKIQMATRALAERVASQLDTLWTQATPQTDGHYVGFWTDAHRTLDFNAPCAQLDRQLRAFGPHECLATVNGVRVHIRRAITWSEQHGFRPGSVVHTDALKLVVACKDGFVALLEWSLFPTGAPIGTP